MINKQDFIFKKNRRFFRATCDQCGSDRGYQPKDSGNKPCTRCNCIRAGKISSSKSIKTMKCHVSECLNTYSDDRTTLCLVHFHSHIKIENGQISRFTVCKCCNKEFKCGSLKAKYCSLKCKKTLNPPKDLEKVKRDHKKWQKNNKEKIKQYRDIPQNKIAAHLRSRLSRAVSNNYRAVSAVKDLGCSIQELKTYLESKFQPDMTWDNYGKWHIDHIRPLNSFNLAEKEEQSMACHFSNLQPLWAKDNISKSDNYEP